MDNKEYLEISQDDVFSIKGVAIVRLINFLQTLPYKDVKDLCLYFENEVATQKKAQASKNDSEEIKIQ